MTTDTPPLGHIYDPTAPTPSHTYAALRGADKETTFHQRAAARQLQEAIPGVDEVVQENAAALARAVSYLAQQGFDQWADLGCGKPLSGTDVLRLPNLVDVAARFQPDLRWLALDSDRLVVTYCRAMLHHHGVRVEQEDLRQPETVARLMHMHLSMARPVAVVLGAVVHFLGDEDARHLMDVLYTCLAPGSKVVLTHVTGEGLNEAQVTAGQEKYYRLHGVRIHVRTRQEISRLLELFSVEDPGLARTIDFIPSGLERIPIRDARTS
ncbi:hypothetical protein HII36_22310 [Nonomuraea sp. NN258]|uniref:SAM-dependent methyltransferase n=1 Tax=Nonomuraea antri TaxID=2730852 RepID=UPI001569C21C|nr:SAM-dependent methyltransferase [Nonomuraea antri]NRQ34553.1 hypothetical protein [Nonomuraea antri]